MNKLPIALSLAAVLTLGGLTGCHDETEDKPVQVPPTVATTKADPDPEVSVSVSASPVPSKSVSVAPSLDAEERQERQEQQRYQRNG